MTRSSAVQRQPVVVVGAGGHAAVVIDLLHELGSGLVHAVCETSVATSSRSILGYSTTTLEQHSREIPLVIAVGDNRARSELSMRLADGRQFAEALIHPTAFVSSSARLGVGTVVMAGAVINARARVGAHAIINTACSVDHDCVLGDFSHISPGARLAGHVQVGAGAHVGTGAVIVPRIVVGEYAVVGAGAVVIRDVAGGATVVGNPARPVRSPSRDKQDSA